MAAHGSGGHFWEGRALSTELRIPMLSMAMEEGTLAEWLVADGAAVEAGAPIYSLESDKSVQEVEAPVTGIIRIIGKVGETYPVGELIGTID